MALSAILDNLNDIPDVIKAHYTEGTGDNEGKWILDVTPHGTFQLEDIGGLKSALEEERDARVKAEKAAIAFKGIDPKAAKTALKKVDEFKNFDADKEVGEKVDAIKADLVQQHQDEVETLKKKNTVLTKQLENELIYSKAAKILEKEEIKGNATLLLPHIRQQTKMRELDDGTFTVDVVSDKGTQRIGDAKGNPMDLEQLILEMKGKNEFSPGFAGTSASGSGSTGASSGTGVSSPDETATQKVFRPGATVSGVDIDKIASGEIEIVTE